MTDHLIRTARGYRVFDSAGRPMMEVQLTTRGGDVATAGAPRGSTVGSYECHQLYSRPERYFFDEVDEAIEVFERIVAPALTGRPVDEPLAIDRFLLELDGTGNKSRIAGNITLATCLSALILCSKINRTAAHRLLGSKSGMPFPRPMPNLVDGAPTGATHGLEILALPMADIGADDRLRELSDLQHRLEVVLKKRGLSSGSCSNQGAVALHDDAGVDDVLAIVHATTEDALNGDVALGIDFAASDRFEQATQRYRLESGELAGSDTLLERHVRWTDAYGIRYLEDGFADTDIDAWRALMVATPGLDLLVAGDDLTATNQERIVALSGCFNAVVVKPNQVGTVLETLEAMRLCREKKHEIIVSQRTAEIEANLLTHIAIAGGARFLKAGGMRRGERVGRYNELIRTERGLGA